MPLDIDNIINDIKKKLKPEVPAKKTVPERDMRQEAMDIGSHKAKEFFGGKDDKGK